MRGTRLLALGASVSVTAVLVTAGTATAAKLYVSPTGDLATKRGSCAKPNGHAIQAVVDAAAAGDTVIVCAGTYAEQVTVGKKLTLKGNAGATVVPPGTGPFTDPLVLAGSLDGPAVSGTITIKGLTVDGQNRAGAVGSSTDLHAPVGIRVENATASVTDNTVTNVFDAAAPGAQTGVGILVHRGSASVATNTVSHFQKNGIELEAQGGGATTGSVNGNTVTGNGVTPDIAQNGIEVLFGATATVSNNHVSDLMYGQAGTVATGILVLQAGSGVKVQGNVLTRFDYGIDVEDTTGAQVRSNTLVGGRSGSAALTPLGCATDLRGIDALFDDGSPDGSLTISIQGNTVSDVQLGTGLFGCQTGLAIYDKVVAGADVTVTSSISGNTVSSFQKNGITVNGIGNTAKITSNTVTGSGTQSQIGQNLIQIGFGAGGVVGGRSRKGNHLNDIGAYTGTANDYSAGVLLYDQQPHTKVNGNVFRYAADVTAQNQALTQGGYVLATAWDQGGQGPDVDATKNDWDTTSSSRIAELIYDANDDPTSGLVDFIPIA